MSWDEKIEHWLVIATKHAVAVGELRKAEKMLGAIEAVAMLVSDSHAIIAQKRDARASQAYRDAIERLAAAAQNEQELSARLEAGRMRFEIWRTEQATRRAEMNLR